MGGDVEERSGRGVGEEGGESGGDHMVPAGIGDGSGD